MTRLSVTISTSPGPGCHAQTAMAIRPSVRTTTALRGVTQAQCATCHEGGPMEKPSRQRMEPAPHGGVARISSEACATCHQSGSCTSCHGLTMPHASNWPDTHAKTAVQNADSCSRCHTQGDCRSCHEGFEMPHPDNWGSAHGAQARSAPERCAGCHDKPDSCSSCHSDTRPESHGVDTWLDGGHGTSALTVNASCKTCHQDDYCAMCHGDVAIPHPRGWVSTHTAQGANDPASCATCHETAFCQGCHQLNAPTLPC